MELEVMMEPVDLPQSVEDIYQKMKGFKLIKKIEDFPPDVQKIVKYSGTALKIGRPLNKVMIVMAGRTGSGKSSTINSLFNCEICKTDCSKSDTREITEYSTELCVTAESPHVKGILSFVDAPGPLDVESRKEALNLAIVTKFRETHSGLAKRSGGLLKLWKVRERVYPNLVLMVVDASDNCMVGNDSNLTNTLKIVDKWGFVDNTRDNLICVVTHAMSLARVVDIYKKKCAEVICQIQRAVHEVLGVWDVTVVFVENKPGDFGAMKEIGSDFYKLPDGQLSHYNLIMAIDDHFKKHKDALGKLFCSWYFNDTCPNKQDLPKAHIFVNHSNISAGEANKAQKTLDQLKIATSGIKHNELPRFPFQYLGRGYCPITESTKSVIVYSETATSRASILESQYTVPTGLTVVPKIEHHYQCLSYETRKMYEESRPAHYKLEPGVKLGVTVDPRGRWVKNSATASTHSVVSVLYENRRAIVRIDETEIPVKEELMDAIKKLPTMFNTNTEDSFSEFFSKWGTHFICNVLVGGCIKVEYSVNASKFTNELSGKLMNQVMCIVKGAQANTEFSMSRSSPEMDDVYDEYVTISGGAPPNVTTLTELEPQINTWLESIENAPSDLPYSFELCPYYNLADGKCKTSLRKATFAYLCQNLPQIETEVGIRRNDVSNRLVGASISTPSSTCCFPPSATVCCKEGTVAFQDLKPGAKVLTVRCEKKLGIEQYSLSFTEIYAYIHYAPEMVAHYFKFCLENGNSLTVTGDHLIFVREKGAMRAVRAKQLKIGDSLISMTDLNNANQIMKSLRIVEISQSTIKGMYSPLTYDGKLLVNGNLVSCYANIDSHTVAHASIGPLRSWHVVCKATNTVYYYITVRLQRDASTSFTLMSPATIKSCPSLGIHIYAKFLMVIRKFLQFKLLQD